MPRTHYSGREPAIVTPQASTRALLWGPRLGTWLASRRCGHAAAMIILGVVLLIIGFIFAVHIIWILGVLALVVGAVLAIAGFAGHEIGGRRHYF